MFGKIIIKAASIVCLVSGICATALAGYQYQNPCPWVSRITHGTPRC